MNQIGLNLSHFLKHPTAFNPNDPSTSILSGGYTTSSNNHTNANLQTFHTNILNKISQDSKKSSNNNNNNNSSTTLTPSLTDTFLWQDYINGLPVKLCNDKALQARFTKLQNCIANWCSEESLRYLGSFVSLVYHNVGPIATLSESKTVKTHLETTLGPIDLNHWNEIYDLAHTLYTIRCDSLDLQSANLNKIITTTTTDTNTTNNTNNNNNDTQVKASNTILTQQVEVQKNKVIDTLYNITHDPDHLNLISLLESHMIELTDSPVPFTTSSTQSFFNDQNNLIGNTDGDSNNNNNNNKPQTPLAPLLVSSIPYPFSLPPNTPALLQHPSSLYYPQDDIFNFALDQSLTTETSSSTFDSSSTSTSTTASSAPVGSFYWVFDHITAATGSIDSNLLTENTITLLKSKRSNDVLQGELLDFLGFDAIEVIGLLLSNRDAIINNKSSASSSSSTTTSSSSSTTSTSKSASNSAALKQHQALLQRFHKMSTRAKDQTQQQQVYINSKKSIVNTNTQHHDKVLSLLSKYRQQGVSLEQLHHVNQQQIAAQALSKIPHIRISDKKLNYEEIIVPPQTPDQLPPDQLVDINSAFHPLLVPAFGSITHLNTLQTKVFPSAYGSGANMLCCAPTGAGKTNVALMTVLQQVQQYIIDYNPETKRGVIDKHQFKIIYVAPMKALAAEVADKLGRALSPLGLTVRELTGDMQLTKKEIMETQLIVTTPEKWDVITRKSNDGSLLSLVKLLIIDEIHLLHEERGPVLETIVARTHRHIETSQLLCRIVGLSATLPNYRDVAQFLAVTDQHLHFFDSRYRPVPLEQHFIGVRSTNPGEKIAFINEVCYDRTIASLQALNQVMVFVHARRDTLKTGQYLISQARKHAITLSYFDCTEVAGWRQAIDQLNKISNSNEVRELARQGIGVHHAGLTRAERSWMEKAFMKGYLSVLVCTATLSWGVNLPAHTVILKGTELYDPKRGGFVDVSMLDVNQIFGRAGRPQFDTSGEAILITTSDKLGHYISLLTSSLPIESQMIKSLPDHLNAEIILGTVTNLREADTWLTYTYLYTRMLRNPTHYGVSLQDRDNDPMLHLKRRTLITNATKELMKCKMVKFDLSSGNFYPTDIGRVASIYYIHHNSIEQYNELLQTYMNDEQIFHLISHSKEFENLQVRDEEVQELSKLIADICMYKPLGGLDSYIGKANILLQCYISGYIPQSSTLQSDQYFIQQSADRVIRALFEMVLRRGKAALSAKLLDFCKMINHRQWPHQHILRQCVPCGLLKLHDVVQLERAKLDVEDLLELTPHDLTNMVTISPQNAKNVLRAARNMPWLHLQPTLQPLTRDVIRINIDITCQFEWNPQLHGDQQYWWIWIESPDDEHILHHEQWICTRQMSQQTQFLSFTIPISDPLPTQYILKAVNDTFIGTTQAETLSFHDILLPQRDLSHPPLLPLHPIPTTALNNPRAIQLFKRFTHFNPVQTQAFHTLYHTDTNVLLGAPTGSGKTVVCELAMLRALSTQPGRKIIYIAPMKALVRERYLDWSGPHSFAGLFGCSVLELTGDSNPEIGELHNADIVITSPEKIDGLTRSWQTRDYIKNTGLVIIDEIHLLGQDRGSVLEVLVSRMRYIAALRHLQQVQEQSKQSQQPQQQQPLRFIGLSTAMSNAQDIADWLNIPTQGLFNFHPAVRPVPLTTFIAGFPGKAYCPRNATMNKPCYAAITTHSPTKPVLIFVSSRRQTRLTALDIISLAAADGKPKQFLKMDEDVMEHTILPTVSDPILRHCLSFGIGLHHAGLIPKDREIVESLYIAQHIQLLIATSVVAWGVNYPCHLVIVKDCSFYDTKTFKYVDYQITDVLQMIGRSGRPQFDTEGKAVVLCQDSKKAFYQKFLHSPFPIESSLHKFLHNHLNAEIAQGAIHSLNDAVEWLSWTFLFRRLLANPTYYGLPASASSDLGVINEFVLRLLHRTIDDLVQAACITATISPSGLIILQPTSLGQLAALYYIDYRTAKTYWESLHQNITVEELLQTLCQSQEFWEVPVRHNEDRLNTELMKDMYYKLDPSLCGNPHVKTNILFQSRLLHLPLPISDYHTDTQSVLAQSARMFSCLIDIIGQSMWYTASCNIIYFLQMMVQGHFIYPQCEFYNIFVLANNLSSSIKNNDNINGERKNDKNNNIDFKHNTNKKKITTVIDVNDTSNAVFTIEMQQLLLSEWKKQNIYHIAQVMDMSWNEFVNICRPTVPSNNNNNNKTHNNHQSKQSKQSPSTQLSIPLLILKQIYNIIQAMPKINIKIQHQNPLNTITTNNNGPTPLRLTIPVPPHPSEFITEQPNNDDDTDESEQVLPPTMVIPITVSLQRENSWFIQQSSSNGAKNPTSSREPVKIIGPSDVKTTKEGWFLLLSTPTVYENDDSMIDNCDLLPTDLLLAHKHVSISKHSINVELLLDLQMVQTLYPKQFSGHFRPFTSQPLKLTLFSDCYIGVDQQYDIVLDFVEQ